MDPVFDARSVRAVLAAEQITHAKYAEACRISKYTVSGLLTGKRQPGELARRKLYDGLVALGLDRQAAHAA
ncbi:MAG TPA: hypothetical protein VKC57_12265 [Ktedonobacterales bacterium]|nr:hypothetical protein [Ktedonobacterales bacterium]